MKSQTPTPTPLLRTSALLALFLPILAACNKNDETPVNHPLSVLVEQVSSTAYAPTSRITGEVRARVESNLSFQVSGRILERTANVGDHVAAGQVLATLDQTEKQADLRQAEASLNAAEAVLRQAESSFQRQQALLDKKIATRKDYDRAEETLRTSRASVDVARNQVETAREQLSYTVLKAARPGYVTALNVEAGQVVQAAETVYAIAEDGPRDAVFDLDESVLSSSGPAPSITVSLVADPTVSATGTVREVSPTVDPSTGTVRVKVEIKDPPQAMAFGAAVVGEATWQTVSAVILPSAALFSDGGRSAVWLVDPADKRVSLKPISINSYEADSIVVADGLKQGDIVVTRGGQLLHPGQTVATVTEEPK
jgi:RND family efflux transporter MFP subunit